MSPETRKVLIEELSKAIDAECGWCRGAIPLLANGWQHRQYNGQLNMCLASNYLRQRLKEIR